MMIDLETQTKSLSQQAYEQLRRKIVSLELEPGSVIDEAWLQEELAMGRTPIREALLRLSQERLAVIVPRRSMFVAEIGLTDLQKLSELRLVLEPMAARLAAERGQESHWRQMEEALLQLEQVPADNQRLIEVDERCHRIIYEAAENKFLSDALNTHFTLGLRLWHYAIGQMRDLKPAVAEHQAMLDAMRAGDGEAAAAIMKAHIARFQEEIQSILLR